MVPSGFATEGVPRIGIISDAGARHEADLLLIELQKAKCEMVERDEIGKVLKEQAFQAGFSRTEVQRIGQVLKADGLVLLSSGTNNALSVRFVAVAPGVIVWFAECDTKTKDKTSPAPSVTLAGTLAGYLPKLMVKKSDALGVSVFPIRPALGTTRAAQLANDLTRLLQLRLVREPSLFILERENLRRMDEEQRWAGKDSEFWSGSYLVDGSIHHDVIQTNHVTVTLSVRPPSAADKKRTGVVVVEEKGTAAELVKLVERATAKLCDVFGARVTAPAWDTTEEGRQLVALAKGLPDPAQKKIALESALALGYRDVGVGAAYRDVLLDIVYRGKPVFSNLVDGPERAQQAQEMVACLDFVNTFQPTGGFTPETEKRFLFCYYPPLYEGCYYLWLVSESGAGDELREWVPQIQEQCRRLAERMQRFEPKLGVYGRRKGGGIPGCFADYAPFLHPRMADVLTTYRKADLRFRPREKIEPAFPTTATESQTERDALWQQYMAETRSSTNVNVRYDLWCSQLPFHVRRYGGLPVPNTLEERRKLQDEVLAHPDFWPIIAANPYWPAIMFPRGRQSNDSYFEWSNSSGHEVEVAAADIRENVKRARQWFLALLKGGVATCGWVEAVVLRQKNRYTKDLVDFPYADLYSETEAKEVYDAILKRDQELTTAGTTDRTDLSYIRDCLAARFPAIMDDVQKARDAKRVAEAAVETVAVDRFRRQAVQVTREYLNLPAGRHHNSVGPFTISHWETNRVWFTWADDIVCLDPTTRKYTLWPSPIPLAPCPYDPPYDGQLTVTKTFLVFSLNHVLPIEEQYLDTLAAREKRFSCTVAVRRHDDNQWQRHKFSFMVFGLAEAGGKLHAIIGAPSASQGIVTIDPATFQANVLVDPVVHVAKPDPKSDVVVLLRPDGQTQLKGRGDELLVWYNNQYCCAWQTQEKTVRKVSQKEWNTITEGSDPYRFASRKFGFELWPDPPPDVLFANGGWGTNSPSEAARSGAIPMTVRCVAGGEVHTVPLVVDEPPRRSSTHEYSRDWRGMTLSFRCDYGRHRQPILTATSMIVPFDHGSARRGFWEIPYADIRTWLASNYTGFAVEPAKSQPGGK
jgi:hypothetical protein